MTAMRLIDVLTPRQMEVVSLMAEGLDNYEISRALVLEAKTVNRHISAIFSRLGLGPKTGRVKAVLMYLRERAEAERVVELAGRSNCPGHQLCRTTVVCR